MCRDWLDLSGSRISLLYQILNYLTTGSSRTLLHQTLHWKWKGETLQRVKFPRILWHIQSHPCRHLYASVLWLNIFAPQRSSKWRIAYKSWCDTKIEPWVFTNLANPESEDVQFKQLHLVSFSLFKVFFKQTFGQNVAINFIKGKRPCPQWTCTHPQNAAANQETLHFQ